MKQSLITLSIIVVVVFSVFAYSSLQKKNIGLQLYSLRDDIKSEGIEKVLDDVAEIGYTSLELAGYSNGLFYGLRPETIKDMANRRKLTISGSSAGRLMSDDQQADLDYWTQAIEAHRKLGVSYLIMPAPPFSMQDSVSLTDIERVCRYFNSIGHLAANAGIKFGFHNHDIVFTKKVNGAPIYDLMLAKLDPELVFMEMDVFWVHEAGYNPVDYLKAYPGRFPVLHIKDQYAVGASGNIDFEAIFEAAYATGMESYFVEVEWYESSPMEEARKSFDFLNQSRFVK